MNAGQIYETAIWSAMVLAGIWIVLLRFGILARFYSAEKQEKIDAWKHKNPTLLAIIGPAMILVGVAQIVRQF
jgi:hypothetical protein